MLIAASNEVFDQYLRYSKLLLGDFSYMSMELYSVTLDY